MSKHISKSVLLENDQGVMFSAERVSPLLFHYYILKKRTFKDKTHLYELGVEYAKNPKQHIVFERIRGHKIDATKRLSEIMRSGQ